MNTNGQEVAKSHKLKTIIVATIAFVVILCVGIWAISGAINTTKSSDGNVAEVSVSDDQAKVESTNPTGLDSPSPADQYTPTAETGETPVVEEQPAPAVDLPTTGPAEMVFSALMVGVVVFLIGLNINLVKENQ